MRTFTRTAIKRRSSMSTLTRLRWNSTRRSPMRTPSGPAGSFLTYDHTGDDAWGFNAIYDSNFTTLPSASRFDYHRGHGQTLIRHPRDGPQRRDAPVPGTQSGDRRTRQGVPTPALRIG